MAKEITVALVGNPNSGKTTLFNSMTGAKQHVGNWPGVTVEKKEGYLSFDGCNMNVVDLPGVYSLTAYSPDEVVARDFIIDEVPDVVVDIVDASNLERNLYLTVQLMEMGARVVIALNMMDMAKSRRYEIDTKELSRLMGVPVVPMVASRNQGKEELLKAIVDVAADKVEVGKLHLHYGKDTDEELDKLEKLIETSDVPFKYPPRWVAVKLLEDDEEIVSKLKEENVGL